MVIIVIVIIYRLTLIFLTLELGDRVNGLKGCTLRLEVLKSKLEE